jgi:hypothetical protein
MGGRAPPIRGPSASTPPPRPAHPRRAPARPRRRAAPSPRPTTAARRPARPRRRAPRGGRGRGRRWGSCGAAARRGTQQTPRQARRAPWWDGGGRGGGGGQRLGVSGWGCAVRGCAVQGRRQRPAHKSSRSLSLERGPRPHLNTIVPSALQLMRLLPPAAKRTPVTAAEWSSRVSTSEKSAWGGGGRVEGGREMQLGWAARCMRARLRRARRRLGRGPRERRSKAPSHPLPLPCPHLCIVDVDQPVAPARRKQVAAAGGARREIERQQHAVVGLVEAQQVKGHEVIDLGGRGKGKSAGRGPVREACRKTVATGLGRACGVGRGGRQGAG